MPRAEEIKATFERSARALALRPAVGRGTAITKVKLRDGLTCDVEDGAWKLTVDMSPKSGGDARGPDPGVYGRTALGSCLAITYTLWGAKLGVSFSSLEVDVYADYDSAGYHGVAEIPPGYSQVRYVVTVESEASEADVLNVLDLADAHSSYRDVFTRALDVRREVRVTATRR
jgi:uncharacterized OsmC-like protein